MADTFFLVTEHGDQLVTEDVDLNGDFLSWRDELLPPWIGIGLALIITESGDPLITDDSDFIVWRGLNQSITRRYLRVVPAWASTPQLIDLPAVAPTQVQTVAVDFGNFLPPRVTLQSVPTLSMSVRLGLDADPSSRINVGPIVGTAPTSLGGTGFHNTAIIFQIHGCLDGVTYLGEMHCDRSDGDVAEGWLRFACIAPS